MNTPKQYNLLLKKGIYENSITVKRIGLPIGVVCRYTINISSWFNFHPANINSQYRKHSKKTSEWHYLSSFTKESIYIYNNNSLKIKKDLNTLLDQEYFHKKNDISQEKLNV
jgi:hypothetical protein